jgi:hypothetical protein
MLFKAKEKKKTTRTSNLRNPTGSRLNSTTGQRYCVEQGQEKGPPLHHKTKSFTNIRQTNQDREKAQLHVTHRRSSNKEYPIRKGLLPTSNIPTSVRKGSQGQAHLHPVQNIAFYAIIPSKEVSETNRLPIANSAVFGYAAPVTQFRPYHLALTFRHRSVKD